LDHEPPRLSVEFNLIGQLRLIQKDLWNADAAGVADPNDPSLGGHVTTL
jgi:hypothetical protein